MSKLIDLTGKNFGRLTVVVRGPDHVQPNGHTCPQWYCKCECGNENLVLVMGSNLRRGATTSCGCIQKERARETNRGKNTFDFSNEYVIGYTQNGKPFWFDKDDYDKIKGYYWWYNAMGYVCTNDYNSDKRKVIYLHRLIMNFPDKRYDVDHIKHAAGKEHKIDNRKSNLRIVTHQQNGFNQGSQKATKNGYIGIYYDEKRNKYEAQIRPYNHTIHLGRFDNIDDAIAARLEAEKKYYGEYGYGENNLTIEENE